MDAINPHVWRERAIADQAELLVMLLAVDEATHSDGEGLRQALALAYDIRRVADSLVALGVKPAD